MTDFQKSDKDKSNHNNKRLVWDIPTRLFHWLLVGSIAASWATAKVGIDWTEIHFLLGYWTAGLILFRIVWGFIGPKHARFSNFFPSPKKLQSYLKDVLKRDSKPSVGHNPIGAFMVFALLAILGIQVATGLFASDDIFFDGPFKPAVDDKTSEQLTRIHNFNFDILLILIAIHILAIIAYLGYKKQNLILPMITGKKKASIVPKQEAIASSRFLLAIIAAFVIAIIIWAALTYGTPAPSEDDFF